MIWPRVRLSVEFRIQASLMENNEPAATPNTNRIANHSGSLEVRLKPSSDRMMTEDVPIVPKEIHWQQWQWRIPPTKRYRECLSAVMTGGNFVELKAGHGASRGASPGRHHFGMMVDIKSERWARSFRNDGRDQSESA